MSFMSSSSSSAARVALRSAGPSRRACAVDLAPLAVRRRMSQLPPVSLAHPTSSLPLASRSNSPLRSTARARRSFSVQPARQDELKIADITEHEYAPLADETMNALHDSLEELVEGDQGADGGWEVEYSSGVLTLSLGDSGTYVINKQPPNKQIWLSSPSSGPKRYNWSSEERVWFNARDGSLLKELLEEELSTITGGAVELDFGHL